ncbi:hypothetical protein SEA_NIOBE_58 [Arthrobacter phage Niobe]|uniref:Uncharacterized protein n=1 Tax=Arthrobacter phage Elezi TaxID=2762410 RepID=A0A7G8LH35_9CAUD|nr:hypothetical protein PQE13_gp57 [Arthrobacter phage Elezi]QNJ56557.1 hypothetical protein SEA_ELEZI_57 [Arthrobacter phage Elezi]QOP64361.1 hypothetical protein SEA_LONDON_58 [Arthrobacter phage London]UAJ15419.1 hypothetical protein SEA_ASA16_58 [Arthrobacter phage Asa16]
MADAPEHGELAEIRKRTRNTREVINGARQRQNYIIESPAQLDREALLRAVDAALATGHDDVRRAVHAALQK